jgi:hypothetical protein
MVVVVGGSVVDVVVGSLVDVLEVVGAAAEVEEGSDTLTGLSVGCGVAGGVACDVEEHPVAAVSAAIDHSARTRHDPRLRRHPQVVIGLTVGRPRDRDASPTVNRR